MSTQTDNVDSDDDHEDDHLTVMGFGFWKSWRDGLRGPDKMQRMNVASVCFKGDRQVDYFELSMIVQEEAVLKSVKELRSIGSSQFPTLRVVCGL
ncbi:hypothetical protein ABKV19_009911 [Rosa sericea]